MRKGQKTILGLAILTAAVVVAVFLVVSGSNDRTGVNEEAAETRSGSPSQEENATGAASGTATANEPDDIEADELEIDELEVPALALEGPPKPVANPKALMIESSARRKEVKLALEPYASRKEHLHEKIRSEYDLTKDRVPELIAEALQLNEDFWGKGDFDDADNFDLIYEARALLEVCHSIDPGSEDVLWAALEVFQSGWPYMTVDEDFANMATWTPQDKERMTKVMDLQCEVIDGFQALTWKLWDEHVATRKQPTVDDLMLAFAVLGYGPPAGALRSKVEQEHPGISKEERNATVVRLTTESTLPVLEWALKACKQRDEWGVYVDMLEASREVLERKGTCNAPLVLIPPNDRDMYARYWGRPSMFKGPMKRRLHSTYYHEMQ